MGRGELQLGRCSVQQPKHLLGANLGSFKATDRLFNRPTDQPTDQADKQANKKARQQANKQANKERNKQTSNQKPPACYPWREMGKDNPSSPTTSGVQWRKLKLRKSQWHEASAWPACAAMIMGVQPCSSTCRQDARPLKGQPLLCAARGSLCTVEGPEAVLKRLPCAKRKASKAVMATCKNRAGAAWRLIWLAAGLTSAY